MISNEFKDETCRESLTHPPTLTFEHRLWEEFANDVNTASASRFPRQRRRYVGAHVLLLNWLEDDLGTESELIEVEAVFKEHFDYTTERWKIPSKNAQHELFQKIASLTGQVDGQDRLLVIYYGGHGDTNRNGYCTWFA